MSSSKIKHESHEDMKEQLQYQIYLDIECSRPTETVNKTYEQWNKFSKKKIYKPEQPIPQPYHRVQW